MQKLFFFIVVIEPGSNHANEYLGIRFNRPSMLGLYILKPTISFKSMVFANVSLKAEILYVKYLLLIENVIACLFS